MHIHPPTKLLRIGTTHTWICDEGQRDRLSTPRGDHWSLDLQVSHIELFTVQTKECPSTRMATPGPALRRTALASSLFRTANATRAPRVPLLSCHRILPLASQTHSAQIRHSSYSGPAIGENGKPRKKVTRRGKSH